MPYKPKKLFTLAMDILIKSETFVLFPNGYTDDLPTEYKRYDQDLIMHLSPVPFIRKILPKSLYIEYLQKHIKYNIYNWHMIFFDVLFARSWDIVDWDFNNLSIEQVILLKTIPNEVKICKDLAIVLKISHKIEKWKTVCNVCLVRKNNIHQTVVTVTDVIILNNFMALKYIRSNENWCQICKKRPLFSIKPYYKPYIDESLSLVRNTSTLSF